MSIVNEHVVVEVRVGNYKVVWYSEGDKDINKEELLRFVCMCRASNHWHPMDASDFCTRLPLSTPPVDLLEASMRVLNILHHPPSDAECSPAYANALELFSWISPDTFENALCDARTDDDQDTSLYNFQ